MTDEQARGPEDPGARGESSPAPDLVPSWLAFLVLLLLIAVVGLGGYVLNDVLTGEDAPRSSTEAEVLRYETEVRTSPDDPRAHVRLGFAYQQAGRFDDALEEYERALELDPRDTAALYNTGVILLDLGEDDRAEEVLWDVLEIDPEHVLAAKQLGEYYARRGHYRSLLVAVEPVVEAQPQMADLQYLMGLAYENLGAPEEAEERYRLALEYAPDLVEAREGLERLGVSE
jgi:tetratricopeptide (TPR) repeat protein